MWKGVLIFLNPYLDDVKWDLSKMKAHTILQWDRSDVTHLSGTSRSLCQLWGSVPWTSSDTGAEELQGYPVFGLWGHLDIQVV